MSAGAQSGREHVVVELRIAGPGQALPEDASVSGEGYCAERTAAKSAALTLRGADVDGAPTRKGEDLHLLAAARVRLHPGDAATVLRERLDASAHLGHGGRLRGAFAGPNCGSRAENEQETDDDEQTPGHVTIIASLLAAPQHPGCDSDAR